MSEDHDEAGADGHARGGIQSLDTALLVLRAMATLPGSVTLTDLARSVDMPVSKVHRYLASFIHAGLVAQSERSGRYDLGPFASELGLAALARNDFVNRTADVLPELSEVTGATALLSTWGNGGATVVRWERAASPILTSFGLGSTLPLLTSASGRIFLAFLPRKVTALRLAVELARASEAGLVWPDLNPDMASVESLIARVRADRLACVDGRFVPGLRAVSAPVTDWAGEAQVAVTLIGISEAILDPAGSAIRTLTEFTKKLSMSGPPRGG
ncbi:MAG: IclR family transcriptional regulator [Bosea sp.]|uniref:IclR family transcriptional regulator n=1 Tax=Bosea sp. (in: a-proteobacteria) TaxID=1871050 RepID=UPI002386D8DC|nr:IclR family transcriptional regulator [Bosea sp. (in: a-proteobacteria)]MCP4736989.1 IclR family transcriptional regulator [Bosea sp. (in: a-proteobacteria)]